MRNVNQRTIIGYYQDILSSSAGMPLIIYNIPAMSGVSFTLEALGRLLELPGVVGIKQTAIDMYQMEQLACAFPGKVLLNGYDENQRSRQPVLRTEFYWRSKAI